jgi:hypothetical protein
MRVAGFLFKNGFQAAAIALLEEWWNDLGNRQREDSQRVYRAIVADNLAYFFLLRNDDGAAIWWSLHTQADDILGNHEDRGGDGKRYLRGVLGMSQAALEFFDGIGDRKRAEIASDTPADNWSQKSGHPEDMVVEFASTHPEAMALLSRPTSVREYPLSQAYFLSLLDNVNKAVPPSENTSKGNALEDLAAYLLLLIPGLVPARKLVDERNTHESDLVLRDLSGPTGITSQLMGQDILIECKNWGTAVGVEQVGYFLYRMHLTHTRFGIMFSKGGITGSKSDSAATDLIRKAFHEDGDVCIIIDSSDLERLSRRQTTIRTLLLSRSQRAMFGVPR